jgi:hypothetical protein
VPELGVMARASVTRVRASIHGASVDLRCHSRPWCSLVMTWCAKGVVPIAGLLARVCCRRRKVRVRESTMLLKKNVVLAWSCSQLRFRKGDILRLIECALGKQLYIMKCYKLTL